ncbi:MAG TPA: lysine--tRNA ligase [Symbiobacteriaceae bacterium]|jgi:lysyl-tRNA synthetase, class I|nr:lysine--tRNA ligase [Symbiobacteriaceae bacterium]
MSTENKLWPHQEAKRIVERWPQKEKYILQTGFGASGHPHMGTIGEVVRTYYVAMALKDLGKESEIIVFSDDMDGLRKIPKNIDAPWLADHLGKPVTMIPDPYGTAKSFGHHMDEELVEMMARTVPSARFMSATDAYANGTFDEGIRKMFKHMQGILDLTLPTMREENREGWFPWFPICENCGKIYTTKVESYDGDNATVTYSCTGEFRDVKGCGHHGTQSALGGRGKFFWKADWALRWYVFGVNFEMHGKDLIDSAKLSGEIVKLIGGKPPVNMVYELFLTEEGRKISKSTGAGISMENWGRWGTQDSLNLLMFKNPKQQKKLGTDSIIQYTDETLTMTKEDPQYRFIYYHGDRPDLGGLRYSDIINLVNAISVTDPDQLLEYLGRSFGHDRIRQNEAFVRELLGKAINYYEDFILPTREIPSLTAEDWALVDKFDHLIEQTDDGDAIQTGVFTIAKENGMAPKDFFRLLYGVLLGAESGPRIGGFVKLVGKDRVRELISKARAAQQA